MLTVKAAAKRAEVGEATVWRMLADGRLKKYRRAGDRRVYLDQKEVDESQPPPGGADAPSPDLGGRGSLDPAGQSTLGFDTKGCQEGSRLGQPRGPKVAFCHRSNLAPRVIAGRLLADRLLTQQIIPFSAVTLDGSDHRSAGAFYHGFKIHRATKWATFRRRGDRPVPVSSVIRFEMLEASAGFEPAVEVLQWLAWPLGTVKAGRAAVRTRPQPGEPGARELIGSIRYCALVVSSRTDAPFLALRPTLDNGA